MPRRGACRASRASALLRMTCSYLLMTTLHAEAQCVAVEIERAQAKT